MRIRGQLSVGDAATANLRPGADVGLVGIAFATRRRNRANGVVKTVGGGGFDIAVAQSFGNCPKYIQARDWRAATNEEQGPLQIEEGRTLGATERSMIAAADTFFISSALIRGDEPAHGVVHAT